LREYLERGWCQGESTLKPKVSDRRRNLMPPVEQVKAKRAGIGLRACDHDRAFPGFTLFAPQSGGGKVYLIDLDGMWSTPGRCLMLPATRAISQKEAHIFTTERPSRIQPDTSVGNLGKPAWRWKRTGVDVSSGRFANRTIITTA
jgi:hypothetical protein